eukprot:c27288_g1_i1 orf=380-1309(-)
MAGLSRAASLLSNGYEHEESTQSLVTLRESERGSRYVLLDDSGVYLSSVAVTIFLSATATIGIVLLTFVVTLAVLLASCDKKADPVMERAILDASERCHSFKINVELNNVRDWSLPAECEVYISEYLKNGQYQIEVQGAADAARQYLKTVPPKSDSLDVVIMDIDETILLNWLYLNKNHFRINEPDKRKWNKWVMEANASTMASMLELYNKLRASNWEIIFITERPESQRNFTIKNLLSVGYEGWRELIMRSEEEAHLSSGYYKSKHRLEIQNRHYRIQATIGDQWSDIIGPATGQRTFKIPNPIYYID